jgi:DNA-binding PadR family transcriptional regulator
MKVCSKCGIEKDESEFYKDKNTKDGLFAFCKDCQKSYLKNKRDNNDYRLYNSNYQKEYIKSDKVKEGKKKSTIIYSNSEKGKATAKAYYEYRKSLIPKIVKNIEIKETKKCNCCGVEKNKSEFYKRKNNQNLTATYCISCATEKVKQWRKSEKGKAWLSNYRKSEKIKLYSNSWQKSEKGMLCPCKIKTYLGLCNTPTDQIPPELLELKRIQLQIKREMKKGVQNEKTN